VELGFAGGAALGGVWSGPGFPARIFYKNKRDTRIIRRRGSRLGAAKKKTSRAKNFLYTLFSRQVFSLVNGTW